MNVEVRRAIVALGDRRFSRGKATPTALKCDKPGKSFDAIVFEELEVENPFDLGYLEKMKDYSDQYKFWVGDYRVGVTIEKNTTGYANGFWEVRTSYPSLRD